MECAHLIRSPQPRPLAVPVTIAKLKSPIIHEPRRTCNANNTETTSCGPSGPYITPAFPINRTELVRYVPHCPKYARLHTSCSTCRHASAGSGENCRVVTLSAGMKRKTGSLSGNCSFRTHTNPIPDRGTAYAPALCCDKDECKQRGRANVIHVSLSITRSEPNVAAEARRIDGQYAHRRDSDP